MMINTAPLFRFAYTRPIMAGLAAGMVLLLADRALSAPLDATHQAFEKEENTCIAAIQEQERANGIPHGLLQAISLAESGRWFENTPKGKGAIIAWPWTVTTGGKGHYLPGRADAVAYVKSLRADGVENIDVGCMQINLKYHPDAFPSIDKAFDARANAAYAAEFLKRRYEVSKSWMQAAGDYHSTTPDLNEIYRTKVSKLWQDTMRMPIVTAQADAQSDVQPEGQPATLSEERVSGVATIPDRSLMDRFNRAFRERKTGLSSYRPGQEIINRANALKPGAGITAAADQSREQSFAQRRQSQLAAWRLNHFN